MFCFLSHPSLREFFPCPDFPSEPSLWIAACHIHHMCLRPAVSEGVHLRNDNLMSNSESKWHHCFHKGPMMESKVFICASAAELQKWLRHLEDRRYKSMTRPMSPSQSALSYLVRTKKPIKTCPPKSSKWKIICLLQLPCDEHWKREELKTYLMQAPIWQWEGSPIQHMGQPGYISMIHIVNTPKQVTNAPTHSGLS